VQVVDLSMQSPATARQVADNGLAAVNDTFEFLRSDGTRVPLRAAALEPASAADNGAMVKFSTGVIRGSGALEVTDASRLSFGAVSGQPLIGPAIVPYLERVAAYGACEADVPRSVAYVLREGAALRRMLDTHAFVLVGATSALGPVQTLLSLGATVVAISRKGTKLRELLQYASKSPATVIVPMAAASVGEDNESIAAAAGADVLTDAPALVDWLSEIAPGKRLVIGSYIYLDSEAHVRASVAMEIIASGVSSRRKDTALA